MRRWAGAALVAGLAGCAPQVWIPPAVDTQIYNQIAILTFETDSPFRKVGAQLSDEVLVNLLQVAPELSIVERSRLDAVMQERSLASQDILDPPTLRELARILGVKIFMTGTVSIFLGDIRTGKFQERVATGYATIRLIDARTARVLWARRRDATASTIMFQEGESVSWMKTDGQLVQDVIRQLGSDIALVMTRHKGYAW